MRGLRSTIALLVVLAGLSAYIYFVTWKTPATDTATTLQKVFASLDAGKIEEVRITSESGDLTTLKKGGGVWEVASPISAKADDATVSSLASSLGSIEVSRVIDENPTDLAEYGLAAPRFGVEFKATGDTTYRSLLFGRTTPTGADVFAKRGDEKRVFLVASYQEMTFNKSTFDLRDKALLAVDRAKVDGLEMLLAGKTVLQLAREGTNWNMTKPLQVRADYGSVEGLIGRLQTAAMKSSVTDNASTADLKKYGLDKPTAELNLMLGSAKATLVLGAKTPGNTDNAYYARDTSKAAVVTIDAALVDEFRKSANDYRRKDIFEFRAFNAERLEITRDGQSVVFERVKSQVKEKPDTWRRVSPNAGDVDTMKMETFFAKIENTRASSFVASTAKTGLDKPFVTVVAKFEEAPSVMKDERITLGRVGEDTFALRPGEPGAAKIGSTEFDDALKALDEVSK